MSYFLSRPKIPERKLVKIPRNLRSLHPWFHALFIQLYGPLVSTQPTQLAEGIQCHDYPENTRQFSKNYADQKMLTKVPKNLSKIMDVLLPFPFRTYSPLYHKSDTITIPANELLQPKIMLPPYHLQNYCLFYYWRTKPITLGAILCQVLIYQCIFHISG